MDQFFLSARTQLGLGGIDIDTAVFKASLVRGYTYNPAHVFVSDLTGAGGTLVQTSAALTTPSFADGVLDFDDVTFTSVPNGAAIPMLVIYQASAVTGGADVAATAQRLLCVLDGRFRFTVGAAAAGSATSVTVDALMLAIAASSTANNISGTGPATISGIGAAAANARSITCSALASGASVDAVYEVGYSGANLPMTPNGGNIVFQFSSGPNRILRI
jgi:hypothetical protein